MGASTRVMNIVSALVDAIPINIGHICTTPTPTPTLTERMLLLERLAHDLDYQFRLSITESKMFVKVVSQELSRGRSALLGSSNCRRKVRLDGVTPLCRQPPSFVVVESSVQRRSYRRYCSSVDSNDLPEFWSFSPSTYSTYVLFIPETPET
jgi:hypothetical protein